MTNLPNLPPQSGRRLSTTLGWLRRLSGVLLPILALLVVATTVKGAGVPLTLPGVLIAIGLLLVVRCVVGWSRRKRRDHPITPRRRAR